MRRYYGANEFFSELFGEKTYKLALSGGYTCPNRDGTAGFGGCAFCGEGSGSFAEPRIAGDFENQLALAKKRLASKFKGQKFIAYFQSYTATHAPVSYINELLKPALNCEDICALSVATRPDCLPPAVLDLLKEVALKKPLFVELGLQTSNEKTALEFNRGYKNAVYEEGAANLKAIGANVITHVILGLPNENLNDMLSSVNYACKFSDGIKLQLLHVLKNTPFAEKYARGEFKTLSLEQYADILCEIIKVIPKNIVIHRLTGDAPKKDLIAPLWSSDKKRVLNYLNASFEQKNVVQGSAAFND